MYIFAESLFFVIALYLFLRESGSDAGTALLRSVQDALLGSIFSE